VWGKLTRTCAQDGFQHFHFDQILRPAGGLFHADEIFHRTDEDLRLGNGYGFRVLRQFVIAGRRALLGTRETVEESRFGYEREVVSLASIVNGRLGGKSRSLAPSS
jgi:hypothetical protein